MNDVANSNLPLQTISESGKPPAKKLASASDAQQLVAKLVEANQERSRWNSRVKGQLDGNPPYDPAKLKNAGQSYRANINFMEAKASLSSALVPYYDLFAGATYYYNVRCDYGGPDDREYFSGIVTEEFDRMLKNWRGFDFNMQRMLYDLVGYGKGFVFWKNDKSWRFKCAPQYKVVVPDGTDATLENLEVVVVRERLRVDQLWAFIKNKSAAESVGWSVEETVQAIASAFPEKSTGTNQYNFEFIQNKLKDKDLWEGVRCSTVPVAHIFTREFDGTITYAIVMETGAKNPGSQQGKEAPVDFLFEKEKYYENFDQALSAFFLETLDGSWNGACGLGKDIYSAMAIKDRLKCSALDLAFLRTGINLQAKTASAIQNASMIQAGVFNIIPPDYEVQQSTILGDMKSPVDMDTYLDRVISNNTGVYRQREVKMEGNPITAKQAEIDQMNSVVLSNSAINRFYSGLDKLGAELFRRVTQVEASGDDEEATEAREFRKRCEARGVPKDALKKTEYVRAYRNTGNGSLYMRQQAMAQLMPYIGMFPETGRQNYIEDVVSAISGHAMVDRYVPRKERVKLPNDHEAQAMLENAALKIGAPVTWTPTQNNVIHAQVHLGAAAKAAETLQGGQVDPHEILAFMEMIGQHTAVHMQQIAKDPTRKQEYALLNNQFMQLAKVTDKLKAKVQQDAQAKAQQQAEMQQAQMQAQAIAGETDPNTRIKAAETAAKIRMQQEKTDAALQMKKEKHDQNMALADATAAAKISRE